MSMEVVEIPKAVLSSIETLDELEDWLLSQNPSIMADLRKAREEDQAGEFQGWVPRHIPCATGSK
jgi:hypothetical protein